MITPSIDVDIETYELIESYVDAWKSYYTDSLMEIVGNDEFSTLPDSLKRLAIAYNNRINVMTLFLDGINVHPLPFSE